LKIRILLMAVVLTGLLFSLSASAQIACTCDNPITTEEVCLQVPADGSLGTDINTILNIPKFDSSLGCLQSVRITSESCGYIFAEVDSEAQFPVDWSVTAISGVEVTLPGGLGSKLVQFGTVDGPIIIPTATDDPTELPLGNPFNPDFAGSDWGREDFGTPEDPICSEIEEFIFEDEADKALFIGSVGETLPVTVQSAGEAGATGASSNVGFNSFAQMNARVCVEYTYCPPPLCIKGTKTNDCTDEGIPGWEICLTKPDGTTFCTTTDENGDYSFCELYPGDYEVCEETRADWVHVDPVEPCIPVTLIDQSVEDVDFINAPLFCISGHKFNSKTGAGVPGWWITLYENGVVREKKQTGTGGYYEFCGLENGDYKVCEELKSGWKRIGPECYDVTLDCANSENNDFENEPQNYPCVCPFFIKNELYTASCTEIKVVDASKGILANDPPGSVVLNPESITIDPKYGTIEVAEDGSFVYDPIGATGLYQGVYVIFKYNANNGLCDSRYPGIAKIQVSCKRR
jgi:hypothetical protein